MSSTTKTDPSGRRGLRRSALDRPTAMRLAAIEYDRYLDQLRTLDGADWTRPTDCTDWDVRAVAGHNLGMAEIVTSTLGFFGQIARAARAGGVMIDALTAQQVRDRADLTPAELVRRYAAAEPRATAGRSRRSVQLGRLPMPGRQPVGGGTEAWAFGFLFDTVLTRDTWMHRMDTARAVGRPPVLTADHDGVLVADVVAEWAQRHGEPYALTLTGPAGGAWSHGTGGPAFELDAVEFCRILSGRAPAEGLLAVAVPF
jgi:uncharacterized protein (TIGR03083 family)